MSEIILKIDASDLTNVNVLCIALNAINDHKNSLDGDNVTRVTTSQVVQEETEVTYEESAIASEDSIEVDINGIPWDDRIHASSRAKLKGGAWKYKRGIQPAQIKAVESELLSEEVPPPPADIAPDTAPAPPAEMEVEAVAEVEQTIPHDMVSFMEAVTGKYGNAQIDAAIKAAGYGSVLDLQNEEGAAAKVWAELTK